MNIRHNDAPSDSGALASEGIGGPAPAAKLVLILRTTVTAAWDRLGLLLAVSVTWALLISLPISFEHWLPRSSSLVAHIVVLGLVPIIGALPTAGLFALAYRIVCHEEAFYHHMWSDGVSLFWPDFRLILIQSAVAVLLLIAVQFYVRTPFWAGRIALTVCGYIAVVWFMMLIYQWPALIAQEKGQFDTSERRAKRGALSAIRRSLFIAMGKPFFSLSLLCVLISVSILMALTAVLPALVWSGATALLCTRATRDLLIQYGVLPVPAAQAVVPDEQFRLSAPNAGSSRDSSGIQ